MTKEEFLLAWPRLVSTMSPAEIDQVITIGKSELISRIPAEATAKPEPKQIPTPTEEQVKAAVLAVMERKDIKGNLLFKNPCQWYAIYMVLVHYNVFTENDNRPVFAKMEEYMNALFDGNPPISIKTYAMSKASSYCHHNRGFYGWFMSDNHLGIDAKYWDVAFAFYLELINPAKCT